jgi:DNA-binding transcriptional MerR regulator
LGFSAAQAARLCDCTTAQLGHWARSGLVEPGADGYTFGDLVALRVVRSLLDAGLPSTRARVALGALRARGDALSSLRLVTDGRNVWACHDDGQILDALRAGQLALFVAVDQVAASVDADVRAFRREREAFVEQLTAAGTPHAFESPATAAQR